MFQDEATYQCFASYSLDRNTDPRTCQEDGTWSGTAPTCLFGKMLYAGTRQIIRNRATATLPQTTQPCWLGDYLWFNDLQDNRTQIKPTYDRDST